MLLSEQFPLGEVGFGEGQVNKDVADIGESDLNEEVKIRNEY